eukprot:TRINITY_DN94518_c0_g1_i1.p1 TRINITY_DN94518_c0_g1~~TRINITY_DN94518_c0_g1_i1.p1  ORF type:complete len:126 (+),score=21.11 TRINITY_DN94518_c0_g1_i1:69-446(+)
MGGDGASQRNEQSSGSAPPRERKAPRLGLNTSALGSILFSNRRTNARMDRTQFEAAEKELRRVGGDEDVTGAYKQAVQRETKVIETVTKGRMTVSGDRIVITAGASKASSKVRSRSRSPHRKHRN